MTDTQFLIESVFQNLLMWAVPCFLMITGALLLNPEKEITWKKVGKYIFRVALSLVVFTLLFEVIDHVFGTKGNIFTNWLYKLYTGQSWAHMWYLYLLIGMYLMVPFYRMITKNASMNQIGILIVILVFFVSLLPLIDNIAKVHTSFYIPTSIIYPAYFFLGYYLFNTKVAKWIYAIIFALSSVAIVLLTMYRVFEAGDAKPDVSLEYSSILVVLQTTGLFGLLKDINPKKTKVVDVINDTTFGIYLIHFIFVKMILKWNGFNPYDFSGIKGIALMVAIDIGIFIVSFILTYVVRIVSRRKLL